MFSRSFEALAEHQLTFRFYEDPGQTNPGNCKSIRSLGCYLSRADLGGLSHGLTNGAHALTWAGMIWRRPTTPSWLLRPVLSLHLPTVVALRYPAESDA